VHKLRAALTMLGLTMGVAALITVMTIVQGANVYVEQKVANLGSTCFRSRARLCRDRFFRRDQGPTEQAHHGGTHASGGRELPPLRVCGAQVSATMNLHYKDKELQDTSIHGQTPNMRKSTRALWWPAVLQRVRGPARGAGVRDRRQAGG
jgi:ABC-type antimicrobial peptide transport system permease subunit